MKAAIQNLNQNKILTPVNLNNREEYDMKDIISESWSKLSPFWPLKNLIAVNPLQGLEDLPIEQAIAEGSALFQQDNLPTQMLDVNRETIKWCQAFFDDGQATISMPFRELGLFASWRQLAQWDAHLTGKKKGSQTEWFRALPSHPEQVIAECLIKLCIPSNQYAQFLSLMLTTLPGWAAHIKYRTDWNGGGVVHRHPVSQADYLAVRLCITCLLWDDAIELLSIFKSTPNDYAYSRSILEDMIIAEDEYRLPLLESLTQASQNLVSQNLKQKPIIPDAQLVFCIDVRSEPFRRALESKGNYATLGFAGFFGIPAQIENDVTGETYASCPVLLSPKHTIIESPVCSHDTCSHIHDGQRKMTAIKRFYQSVKNNFATPFALVDTVGPFSGLWMGLRNFSPQLAKSLQDKISLSIRPASPVDVDLSHMSHLEKCAYGEGALRMMGLTSNFATIIVFCGHGSETQNNAFATALDCGACGGRHGASNARILSSILNDAQVRYALASRGIVIPNQTKFIAAEHNTTTDEVELFDHAIIDKELSDKLSQLKADLQLTRVINSKNRGQHMSNSDTDRRSKDWAEVRPEWGLAKNAAFIIAPRQMTKDINLEGRSFLHSYDWENDVDGASLTVILTAPMVVAQWINTQYLFSTIDNVAYGAGSKVTSNITGKIGMMQGNASDLMHGLPLQSVFATDKECYHKPLRLMTVVYAPQTTIDMIIARQDVLKKLFGNGWVTLACIDPTTQETKILCRDLRWI